MDSLRLLEVMKEGGYPDVRYYTPKRMAISLAVKHFFFKWGIFLQRQTTVELPPKLKKVRPQTC